MTSYVPYGRQEILQEDLDAVLSVLQSDFLTQGPQVPAFESAVSAYCGVNHAVAVNSATSALHIACLALGLGPGDWLWTSPITFVASANCGLYCGANVDFVDIEPDTYAMSVEKLAHKLARAETQGCLPKIVVPVHFAGQPCDMQAIYALSKRYGFRIIEDASHAIGGRYLGRPIGACGYSDICVFSFHPVKIITTAEGGMALTHSDNLARRMQLLRSHGITRDESMMTCASEGPWYYQQIDLGFNYRLTDLQAALGLSQLGRLDQYVSKRHALAVCYFQKLGSLPIVLPRQSEFGVSAYHLFPILVSADKRDKLFSVFRACNIGVNVHYIPVHLQPFYQKLGFAKGDFPVAEAYYAQSISLPLFPSLTFEEQDRVCREISAFFNHE